MGEFRPVQNNGELNRGSRVRRGQPGVGAIPCFALCQMRLPVTQTDTIHSLYGVLLLLNSLRFFQIAKHNAQLLSHPLSATRYKSIRHIIAAYIILWITVIRLLHRPGRRKINLPGHKQTFGNQKRYCKDGCEGLPCSLYHQDHLRYPKRSTDVVRTAARRAGAVSAQCQDGVPHRPPTTNHVKG